METENKTCENCKYSRQHYYIGLNGLFVRAANSMHCTNGKVRNTSFAKHFNEKKPCKHWLPFEQQKEYTEQKIRLLLIHINKQLENALQVIKENGFIDE